jgi:hypothetical protein
VIFIQYRTQTSRKRIAFSFHSVFNTEESNSRCRYNHLNTWGSPPPRGLGIIGLDFSIYSDFCCWFPGYLCDNIYNGQKLSTSDFCSGALPRKSFGSGLLLAKGYFQNPTKRKEEIISSRVNIILLSRPTLDAWLATVAVYWDIWRLGDQLRTTIICISHRASDRFPAKVINNPRDHISRIRLRLGIVRLWIKSRRLVCSSCEGIQRGKCRDSDFWFGWLDG